MRNNYILVTDSLIEPITLQEVKTYLRIDTNDYDNILTPLIKTVRQLAEKITGRDFINKTWKTYLDCFPQCGIEIKKSKLQSITSIKYYSDSVQIILDPSVYYITDESTYASIYLACNKFYPKTDHCRRQAIEITFVSGYGLLASDVPQALRQAMITHVAYLFNNTGDCADDGAALFRSMYLPYILAQKLVLVI